MKHNQQSAPASALQLLALATTALRDLHMGYPPKEIAALNGQGLAELLKDCVTFLRGQGIYDEGGWDCAETEHIQVTHPSAGDPRAMTLKRMKDEGLTLAECISAFAASNDDPYVIAARQLVAGGDDVTIDDITTTSPADDGAWVLSWLWVSNEEAGLLAPADMLEQVFNEASAVLDGGSMLDDETLQLRRVQLDWLEDLITNYADELDEIATETPKGPPGPIVWEDEQNRKWRFMPSDALTQLRLLARQGDLSDKLSDQAEAYISQYGNKLDAILTVIQID